MNQVEDDINKEKVPKHVKPTPILHLANKDVPQLISTRSLVQTPTYQSGYLNNLGDDIKVLQGTRTWYPLTGVHLHLIYVYTCENPQFNGGIYLPLLNIFYPISS